MSKSSFFYHAEILHSCGKFKISTGSQSPSIVAPRMANILTSENFVKSVRGGLTFFELRTIWLHVGIFQGPTVVKLRVKEGWSYKNCTNVNICQQSTA